MIGVTPFWRPPNWGLRHWLSRFHMEGGAKHLDSWRLTFAILIGWRWVSRWTYGLLWSITPSMRRDQTGKKCQESRQLCRCSTAFAQSWKTDTKQAISIARLWSSQGTTFQEPPPLKGLSTIVVLRTYGFKGHWLVHSLCSQLRAAISSFATKIALPGHGWLILLMFAIDNAHAIAWKMQFSCEEKAWV